MTSFRCYDFLGRPGFLLYRTSIFLSYITLWSLVLPRATDGNYNLILPRNEVHRFLGLTSDLYLVREGVVNEYALSFVVNVPSQIETLYFSWQSLVKKPIHYELTIEFADFIALLPPSSNIKTSGKIPQKLETFSITLPCSGRLNQEISVVIRFNFYTKNFKQNGTVIDVKRNKICLSKELSRLEEQKPSIDLGSNSVTSSRGNNIAPSDVLGGNNPGINTINGNNNINSNSTMFKFQDPTPSLLLAGLLGGCAVTASIVFLTFFICLRRKLVPSSSTDSSYSSSCPGPNTDPNSLSNNSSPACLLRQSQPESKWITLPGSHSGSSSTKDNFCSSNLLDPLQAQQHHHHHPLQQHPHQLQQHAHILRSNSPMTRSWSRNSYVTIASFWNDIFTTGIAGGQQQHQQQQQSNNCHNNNSRASKVSNSTFIPANRTSTNSNNTSSTTTKGSDVSPYAYAHILGIPPPPPPMISLAGTKMGSAASMSQNQPLQQPSPLNVSSQQQHPPIVNPHLLEWYSQASPSCTNIPGGGHIYSNHLYTFNPSPNNSPFLTQQLSSPKHSIMSHMNSPLPPPIPPNTSPMVPPPPLPPTTTATTNSIAPAVVAPVGPDCAASVDGNSSTAGRSGSESLIQIDGWQCRKNFTKETDVVERFL